ncbi:MAG: 30S ribosomal protein S12 methylthiotransferase RimO [bacterium]|uniref:Ribosomal protein uS12 methylthiotransferase RimO n=1 Tax=Candidatus Aphodosoma intestinipullorum TaxID=2840674 RepID=A0A940DLE8_9BACT|nr:30S ribosomal protein S12 methylthiotransferase RimO [Candidatus Aphodosoma intestinipullorum]
MVKNRVDIITLGCSKNLVDSERLMAQFRRLGYEVYHDSSDVKGAVVVVNTCGFIGDAKEESVNMILELAAAKKRRKIGRLFVMGCLSERYARELREEISEVDAFYGKFDWPGILRELGQEFDDATGDERILTTPAHYAYLKIGEGCSRTCSYCAIPIITGKYRSRRFEDIVTEAESLVAKGVKEIQLIAQDLTFYGIDLYKENRLAELIDALASIEGLRWLRLHYAYPAHFPYDILPVMRRHANVCAYLDIALQHISDNMLRLMRRNVTKAETYALLKRIREEVPGIHIRTTLLVGHPGETEEDFEELKEFVSEMRFERLGTFAYSDEEGTYANINYKDDVPDDVKQARLEEIMTLQEAVAEEIGAEKVGRVMTVVIDREEDDFYVGRTEYDSPEVDGEVLIDKSMELMPGEFYKVRITGSEMYDLYAEPIGVALVDE